MKTLFFGWIIFTNLFGVQDISIRDPQLFDTPQQCDDYRAGLTDILKDDRFIKSFSLTCRPYSMVDGSYPEGDHDTLGTFPWEKEHN